MTTESNESAIVEVTPKSSSLVKEDGQSDRMKQETLALIEAIKTKAQSETRKAGDFARENYLKAVSQAREEIEKLNLFEQSRVEEAIEQVQKEVEKDWDALAKQVTTLGDRLNDAAKAAWEVLTAPRSEDDK